MRVWIVKTGEPLPTGEPGFRRMRATRLGQSLAARGHDVTYWMSTFDHQSKRHRFAGIHRFRCGPYEEVVCLHGPPYRRNISLARVINHRAEARQFWRLAQAEQKPDIIVCCLPTLDLCERAVRLGGALGTNVLIDIRDQWPDVFTFAAPRPLRPLGRVMLAPAYAQLRRILDGATGVTATSPAFLEWAMLHSDRSPRSTDAVFPLGYETPPVSAEAYRKARATWRDFGLGDPGLAILSYVGTLTPRASGSLVELAAKFQSLGLDGRWRLVIAGDGELKERLQPFASETVLLPGWLGQPEIRALLEISRFGVIPYPNDPDFLSACPNKFGEYLSAGLPVVSTLNGAVGAILRKYECGFTFGSVAELGEVLKRTESDEPARDRLQRAALLAYRDNFDGPRIFEAFADHVEACAQSQHINVG
jgi:glycosyltransferase involved in cell wall biosynthesis